MNVTNSKFPELANCYKKHHTHTFSIKFKDGTIYNYDLHTVPFSSEEILEIFYIGNIMKNVRSYTSD